MRQSISAFSPTRGSRCLSVCSAFDHASCIYNQGSSKREQRSALNAISDHAYYNTAEWRELAARTNRRLSAVGACPPHNGVG